MKIGIVSQSYYPRYGGVTEHVHALAHELRRRGHEVTIITSFFRRGEKGFVDGVLRIGWNILVPFNRAFVDFAIGVSLKRQLKRAIRRLDLDIVHVHCPTAPTLPIFAVQVSDRPTVGTFHSTGGRTALQDFFKPMVVSAMSRLDGRIAVSATARATAEIYHPGPYEVIPNGVDVERFLPLVAPFPEWRDPAFTNILFVGRLDPRKGVQDLIAAMPEIVERTDGRARLLVVGDSYLRPQIMAGVASSAREHVHFLGHVPSADLPRWYATGDIFISPASGNESFGIVLVEAMAAGTPVVATDIPGYRSVIDPGVNAEAFPPGDVRALARVVSALVEDPARRAQLAERGRARATEFAWPQVTERIEDVYREALAHHGVTVRGAEPASEPASA
jgi:phosphatidylinositol alpha-mannosyltransferase